MTAVPRLSDPPRAIPPGVTLALLARRDEISDSLWHFLPAAAAVGGAAALDIVTGFRVFLLIVAVMFFALGLMAVLRSLARSLRMLWSMRYGFLTSGRIAACRFAWDGRQTEIPFAPFLSNWAVNLDQARTRRSVGRLARLLFIGLSLPIVLSCLFVTAVLLLFVFFGDTSVFKGKLDFVIVAAAWASGVAVVALFAILALVFRGRETGEVRKYLEWRRMAHGERYDANSSELVEALKRGSEPVKLTQKLPAEKTAVELIFRVDYMARGEHVAGEGRVPLCNRLDLGGVEPLLFRPSRLGHVVFLARLPPQVRINAGEWEDLPVGPSMVSLAPPVGVAGGTLAGFAWYLPYVEAMLR